MKPVVDMKIKAPTFYERMLIAKKMKKTKSPCMCKKKKKSPCGCKK